MMMQHSDKESHAPASPSLVEAHERLTSVDVFRGLNMLVMMFSNFLNDRNLRVASIPEWMRHAHKPDTMTYPDVIWPAFTFMLGLSVPLAVERRLAGGQSRAGVWGHIVWRALTLMVMGCMMGNAWGAAHSGCPIGMSMAVWNVLLIVSFLMIWGHSSGMASRRPRLARAVRLAGVALLLGLALVFRNGPEHSSLHLRWWILGTLGWAYLVSASIYLVFRRQPAAIMGCLGLCLLMYMGDRSGALDRLVFLRPIRQWVGFGSLLGVHPAMALVGVTVGLLFTPGSSASTPRQRLRWMCGFAAGLLVAGFLLRPVYGCWKRAATPTWALYSTGISCLIFAGLYALVDVWQPRRPRRWAAPLIPVGTNPLLAYLLADLTYPVLIVLDVDMSASGASGIVRTACLALGLFLLTSWLTAKKLLRVRI